MANLHFRVPVTLDVRLDVDDPVARVHKWRTWPKERPGIGDTLLLRFMVGTAHHTFVGFYDSDDVFIDSVGVMLFCPKAWNIEELDLDELIFRIRAPEEVHWIPLDELLEGVEDAEVEEQA